VEENADMELLARAHQVDWGDVWGDHGALGTVADKLDDVADRLRKVRDAPGVGGLTGEAVSALCGTVAGDMNTFSEQVRAVRSVGDDARFALTEAREAHRAGAFDESTGVSPAMSGG
jgi:hypothetical protein